MSANTDLLMPATGRKAGALTFALLFSLESLVRSLNASVISIQAYDLFGSSRNVSILTTCVSLAVLTTTLLLPFAFRRMRRRWAYTLGVALSLAAGFFLASYTVPGQVAGSYLRHAGASIMNVTLSLYIMDHIRRVDLTRSEPLRLAVSTVSWSAGPALGIWLYTTYGPVLPQLAMIAAALLLLGVFWRLRIADPVALTPGTLQNFNPLANVRRFLAQPRLRLAWAIAFGRSCYWSGLFIYGPILLIEGGLSKGVGGAVVAVSQLLLPFAVPYGWLADRIGVRKVIAGSFAGIATSCAAVGLVGIHAPYAAAGFLLLGALAATGLDGVGGIPFLRAVRLSERQQMASVYRTYIEVSEILPGLVFAVVLSVFDTGSVFIILAGAQLFLAFLSRRYLPKSL